MGNVGDDCEVRRLQLPAFSSITAAVAFLPEYVVSGNRTALRDNQRYPQLRRCVSGQSGATSGQAGPHCATSCQSSPVGAFSCVTAASSTVATSSGERSM